MANPKWLKRTRKAEFLTKESGVSIVTNIRVRGSAQSQEIDDNIVRTGIQI